MTATSLHIVQEPVKRLFAYHAMVGGKRSCNLAGMRIRLREFRDRLNLTLEQMAERTGFSVSMLSRWEAGGSNIPSERLPGLAKAYQCRIADIFEDDDSPYLAVGPALFVIGSVAAGVWKEVWTVPPDEQPSFTGRADIHVPLRDRFGLRVEGESMNDVYPPGTIIECVSFLGGAERESGKRVVVQRKREDGEYEVTVKQYLVDDHGNEWLVPRSSNPAFQRPQRIGDEEPGIVEVRIIGVVVASVRPE